MGGGVNKSNMAAGVMDRVRVVAILRRLLQVLKRITVDARMVGGKKILSWRLRNTGNDGNKLKEKRDKRSERWLPRGKR